MVYSNRQTDHLTIFPKEKVSEAYQTHVGKLQDSRKKSSTCSKTRTHVSFSVQVTIEAGHHDLGHCKENEFENEIICNNICCCASDSQHSRIKYLILTLFLKSRFTGKLLSMAYILFLEKKVYQRLMLMLYIRCIWNLLTPPTFLF